MNAKSKVIIRTLSALTVCLLLSMVYFFRDIDSETDVGVSYTGQMKVLTDTPTWESTYVIDELDMLGGLDAPLDGVGSMKIWGIMYSSPTTMQPVFDSDPALQPHKLEAAEAVAGGSWTVADSALYPTWIADDSSLQQFAVIFEDSTDVSPDSSTPEPASLGLMGLGVLGLAAFGYRKTFGVLDR
jgi:hypothetical protein